MDVGNERHRPALKSALKGKKTITKQPQGQAPFPVERERSKRIGVPRVSTSFSNFSFHFILFLLLWLHLATGGLPPCMQRSKAKQSKSKSKSKSRAERPDPIHIPQFNRPPPPQCLYRPTGSIPSPSRLLRSKTRETYTARPF